MPQPLWKDLLRWETLAVSAVYVLVVFLVFAEFESPDLHALYLASLNFAAGNFGDVYAAPTPVFDLSYPPAWDAQGFDQGIMQRPLYPFIYPPLWTALFAPMTDTIGALTFENVMRLVNAVMMCLCAVLAYRIVRPRLSFIAFIATGLAFVTVTTIGNVALQQNQPQIFLSLLLLLALERDRSEAPFAAGIALALAAAIKLYPALFVLFWLASANWRALGSFVVAGGALGGLSVLLAGWPLHAEFLHHMSTISKSFLASQINPNIDSVIAQVLAIRSNAMAGVSVAYEDLGSFIAGLKPQWVILFDRVALLTGLVLLFLAIRRAGPEARFRGLYPATIAFTGLVAPLTWTHHYLPVAFLLPLLLDRPRGKWVVLALAVLFSRFVLRALAGIPNQVFFAQFLATGLVVWIIVLLLQEQRLSRGSSAS